MKFHLESADNPPVVIISGFLNNSEEIINQDGLKENEIEDMEYDRPQFQEKAWQKVEGIVHQIDQVEQDLANLR